jgi:hypothetical protein
LIRRCYSVLPAVSRSYPEPQGTFLLCTVPFAAFTPCGVRARLACLIHAANVHSEPESNPSINLCLPQHPKMQWLTSQINRNDCSPRSDHSSLGDLRHTQRASPPDAPQAAGHSLVLAKLQRSQLPNCQRSNANPTRRSSTSWRDLEFYRPRSLPSRGGISRPEKLSSNKGQHVLRPVILMVRNGPGKFSAREIPPGRVE